MRVYGIVSKVRTSAVYAINIIFLTLVSVSIIGAIALIPDLFTQISGWVVGIVDVFWIITVACILSKKLRLFISQMIRSVITKMRGYKKFVLTITAFIIVIWQIFLVYNLSGWSGWDPSFLTAAATYKVVEDSYFSVYPNVVFQLFINHFVWILTGQQSRETLIIILNLLNILMLDTALLLLLKSLRKLFNGRYLCETAVLGLLIIGLSPYVAIPYTDIISFLLSSIAIYLVVVLKNIRSKQKRVFVLISLGLVMVLSYMTKPSLLIFYMAIIIAIVLFLNKSSLKNCFISSLILTITIAFSVFGIHYFMAHQDYININHEMREPATHFIAMGMTGKGGFNGKDIKDDTSIETYKERNDANKQKIKKRLKKFGNVTNYQKFLFTKQINNTSDGSFAWGVEGGFLKLFDINDNIGSRFVMKMYAKNGQALNNTFEFRFLIQIVWLIVLVLCWFSAFINNRFSIILKLTIVGFMLFLLLFEGGRSRYVIQFLPFIIMTIPYGIMAIDNLKKKI